MIICDPFASENPTCEKPIAFSTPPDYTEPWYLLPAYFSYCMYTTHSRCIHQQQYLQAAPTWFPPLLVPRLTPLLCCCGLAAFQTTTACLPACLPACTPACKQEPPTHLIDKLLHVGQVFFRRQLLLVLVAVPRHHLPPRQPTCAIHIHVHIRGSNVRFKITPYDNWCGEGGAATQVRGVLYIHTCTCRRNETEAALDRNLHFPVVCRPGGLVV